MGDEEGIRDVDALRGVLSTELTHRGKALRLIEVGSAKTLRESWALLVHLGEVTEADVPTRYRAEQ
jgi:hypothetical protein